MDDDEKKIKHLEMIQGIVNRLAGNSFSMKGWSVTLVSALIAISVDKSNGKFALAALLPAFAFWILDGYFLWQERLFRKLFDAVRVKQKEKHEEFFSMNIAPYLSSTPSMMETTFGIGKKPNTLLCFHGVVVLSALIAAVLLG